MSERPLVNQCATCPWRKGSRNADIPGYRRAKHEKLHETIAEPGTVCIGGGVRLMACHYSKDGADRVCAGWGANQLGPGNNIALRLHASRDKSFPILNTVGPQRASLQATIDEDDA